MTQGSIQVRRTVSWTAGWLVLSRGLRDQMAFEACLFPHNSFSKTRVSEEANHTRGRLLPTVHCPRGPIIKT